MTRGNEWSSTDRVWRCEILGKREEFGVAPHVEVARWERFFAGNFLEGVVVIGDFERGETFFAERFGHVAPEFATFATAELISVSHIVLRDAFG